MMREVIIPLDFPNRNTAIEFLRLFDREDQKDQKEHKPFVKVGMELFFAEGPALVHEIAERGHRIFLDLKAHDIPNTVRGAMASLSRLPVAIVNIHASGGLAMMKAAREGINSGINGGSGVNGGKRPLLIAVTILTSIGDAQMNAELGIPGAVVDTAARLALLAKQAELDGVVCSPAEAGAVHEACGAKFLTVTPGVRFDDADAGDQARVVTPQMALQLGSDMIVVGRPITKASDPVKAYNAYRDAFL